MPGQVSDWHGAFEVSQRSQVLLKRLARLSRGSRERPGRAGRAPGAPQEAQSEPQEAKNELQDGQNEPQEGSGGPKRLRVAILDPPDVVFGRRPLDFHRFHARPEQERGDRDALPPQSPGVGREAAEQGRRRSYGLAVSILGSLSPLSPCFCSLSCRSCSCCSCRSLCSRLTCIACTLCGLSRFPFHDSQVSLEIRRNIYDVIVYVYDVDRCTGFSRCS